VRVITRVGLDALRRTAYDATARDGALALMPDVLLGLLDLIDRQEVQLREARLLLANREPDPYDAPERGTHPRRSEESTVVEDKGNYTDIVEREDVPTGDDATRLKDAKDADIREAERAEDRKDEDEEGDATPV